MRALQARATVRVHGPYGGRGPMLSYGFARPGGPRAPAHHLFPVHLNDGSGLRDTRGSGMRDPVSTLPWLRGRKHGSGPMLGEIVWPTIVPAPPDDAQPGSGKDPDGVRV